MNNYIVYLSFYGKKMKVRVSCSSKGEVFKTVASNINFIKIVEEEPQDKVVDDLRNMFGMNK